MLHQRNYTDSRVLLEFFTEHSGRIPLVARKHSRQQSAQFYPFQPQLVAWRGTSDLKTLRSCEAAEPRPYPLQGKLHFCGLYLNELVLRALLPSEAQPRLFPQYEKSLRQLSAVSDLKDAEPILRQFELTLLEESGIAFDYRSDYRSGTPIEGDRRYELHLDGGFTETPVEPNPKLGIFAGADLLAIADRDFSAEQVCQTAKYLVRLALMPLLGDKPLKSRELFK